MPLQSLEPLDTPEEPSNPKLQSLEPIPPPTNTEVLSGVPQRVGMQFIQSGGGILQSIGDLIRSDSLSDFGADIAKTATGALEDITPSGMTPVQQIGSAGAESALQMAPAVLLGPESVAAAGIGVAATQQFGQSYAELRDKGFGGGVSAFHAGVDALAEALGEKISLPVLANVSQPFLRQMVHFVSRELVGEEFTTVMQQANAMLSTQPNMTWGQFLEGMKQTALVTPVAALLQGGMARGAAAARGLLPSQQSQQGIVPPQMLLLPPPQPKPNPAPPVPTDPGPALPPGPTTTSIPVDPKDTKAAPDPFGPPSEPPGGQQISPEAQKTLTASGYIPAEAGGWPGYYNPQIDAHIREQSAGWEIVAMQPDGSGWTAHVAKSLEDAAKWAQERGHNVPMPIEWGWNQDLSSLKYFGNEVPEGYYLRYHDTKPSAMVPAGWILHAPDGSMIDGYGKGNLDNILKHAALDADQHNTDKIWVEKPSQPKTVEKDPPGMFQELPEDMLKNGTVDPLMFDGMLVGRDTLKVSRMGDNSYTVDSQKTHFSGTAQEAMNEIANASGMPLAALLDPKNLNRVYDEAVLSRAFQGRMPSLVSLRVHQHFGSDETGTSHLPLINALGDQRFAQTGVEPMAMNGTLVGIRNRVINSPIPVLDHSASKTETYAVRETLKPGTYFSRDLPEQTNLWKAPRAIALMKYIEQLRKIYLPNGVIVLKNDGRGAGFNGGITNFGPGQYQIMVKDITAPIEKNGAQTLKTAAHEFGHLIVFEHLQAAEPAIKAKVVASWLEYTQRVSERDDLNKYMAEHNLFVRGDSKSPGGNGTIFDQRIKNPKQASYILSIDEYLADQAAGILTEMHPPVDPTVRRWYMELWDKLRSFWATFNTKFKQNETWAEFIRGVAGNHKMTSRPPKTNNKPTPTLKDLPPKANPTQIKDPQQAELLATRAMKMMDEAYRAGIPKDLIDALSPTGLIKDINWDAAARLLDSYGVPRWTWMDNTSSDAIDDSSLFRESINRVANEYNDGDPELQKMAGNAAQSVKSFNWLLQKTMTAVQLRKRFGDLVPGVKNFVDTLEKMYAYRSRWKGIADDRLNQMRKTSKAERERVFELMLEEDKTGSYLSKITMETDPQFKGQRKFTLTPEAMKKYGLTEQGQALYDGMRKDFDNALVEMEQKAIDELYRLYRTNVPALQKAEAELRQGFSDMRAKPYVPHTRFGDYTVSVRDGNGKLTEFYQFESERDAKKAAGQLRNEHGKNAYVSMGKMTEQMKLMAGLPPGLVNAMKTQLQLSESQIAAFEDILKDMSNGASFVRRFKRRKNIAGWEDDAENMPRAYADYMSRFANHISRLAYNHVLTDAVGQVRQQATDDARMGVNTLELNNLTNWLQNLQEYINNPGVEYTNARAAATVWYLGFNLKSAVVNALSVPMVTVPYLGSRFGDVRSMAAVTQSYKDVMNMYLRPEALTEDERKMIQYLKETGKIDASFASELAGIREGGRLSDQMQLTKMASVGFNIKYWAMMPFQKVEVLNRQVTALAAYRLNKTQKSFDPNDPLGFDQKAAQAAGLAVQDTQNENGQWNRAEFTRGRKGLLTMFMSYNQNVIYQMFGGDQSWMRLLAVQFMAAGLMGMPFAKDFDDVIKFLARSVFGSDINAEKALRQYFRDTLGSDWALNGLSSNMGGIDVSGSVGMGKMVPGVDALSMQGSFADKVANAAGDVGGAGISTILQILKAANSNDPDNLRRATTIFPQFVQSFIQGGQMLTSGKALDGHGNELADVTPAESLARSVGFQVSDVTKERAKRFAEKDSAQYWIVRRQAVLAIYKQAMNNRDGDWMDKANTALRAFNDEAPDAALRITAKQVRESMRGSAMSKYRTENDLGASKTVQQTTQRIGELYK